MYNFATRTKRIPKRTNQQSFANPADDFGDFVAEAQTYEQMNKGWEISESISTPVHITFWFFLDTCDLFWFNGKHT